MNDESATDGRASTAGASSGTDQVADVVAAHERRLAGLDPWLPTTHPLPALVGDEHRPLHAEGAVGLAVRDVPDPDSLLATWGAAVRYRLVPRVGGAHPAAAMAQLLGRWRAEVTARAPADERDPGKVHPRDPARPDTQAGLTWPARDPAMTQLLLDHGLVPGAVVAARPAGRPSPPAPSDGPAVRELRPEDFDPAAALWREEVRWDAQLGTATERPSTAAALRAELVDESAGDPAWVWVTGPEGAPDGLLVASPPERADWVTPLTSRGPVAYLSCLVVAAGRRGSGVGAALVQRAHATLDAAGVGITLLHYGALNPLSGPFWHRYGYRPLWMSWQVSPASRLGSGTNR